MVRIEDKNSRKFVSKIERTILIYVSSFLSFFEVLPEKWVCKVPRVRLGYLESSGLKDTLD